MFRKLSKKYFEPISMWLMILGLVSIVQPWSMFFHRYSVVIILIGLVAFIFFSHIKSLPEEESPSALGEIDAYRWEVGPARPQNLVIDEPTQKGAESEHLWTQRNDKTGSPEAKEEVLSAALKEME